MKKMILIYFLLLVLTILQNLPFFNKIQGSSIGGLITPFISIFSVFMVVFLANDKQWLEKEIYNRQGLGKVLISIFGSIAGLVIFHFLWNQFYNGFGATPLIIKFKDFNIFLSLTIHLTFFCLIEELLFRGFFQEEIRKMSLQLPKTLSLFYQILIPTILFTFMHFFKLGAGCLLIIIPSIIFGGLKYYSGNIYAAIGSHLIFNLYHSSLLDPPF